MSASAGQIAAKLCRENQEMPDDFETLANRHKDAVYRQMIRACGNREDAEDVLIEALLKAYRHLDQLRDSVAFQAWLAQIARRVCWQLKEKEALLPLMQLSALAENGTQISSDQLPPEREIAGRQMRALLHQAVRKLPDGQRQVFEMRDIQGIRGDAAAKQLGISRAAMKSNLHRARKTVREYLDAALIGKLP